MGQGDRLVRPNSIGSKKLKASHTIPSSER
jgi:hypothetical protein